MKTTEQIEKELDEKIPRDVVSRRDGGGGRKLDYLEGWYVIDRLNKVFGATAWSKEIVEIRLLEGPKPSYLVKVRLTLELQPTETNKYGHTITKEGIGYGSDKSGLNPHELAIKEAVTDALKVAAKDLGMSMGLALYDKTQENVEDVKETEKSVSRVLPGNGATNSGARPRASGATAKPEEKESNKRVLIAETARVVIAKKKRTKEALVEELGKEFKVSTDGINTAEDLAKMFLDKDVDNVLTYLKAQSL